MKSNWPIGPCSGGTCVDAIEIAGTDGPMFRFYSTITGLEGPTVDYTPDEVAAFFADVKAGKWDHLQSKAERMSAALVKA